ncbi:MAG TPA: type I polyketide synthase [Streptosporangiaceae bacterium]|jgi:acyl transferase domain-containing protein/acyl carrier protein
MSPARSTLRPKAPSPKNDPLTTGVPGAEPIAVIGIGCRMPGAAGWPAFWRMLLDGTDAITEIPQDRFDVEALYDPRPGSPGKMATRWGGMVDDIAGFDAAFFGVSPREAVGVDPQQRLLLEVCWEAMEDAGVLPESLAGSGTGVFIGETSSDYGALAATDPSGIDGIYTATGSAGAHGPGRVSFALDLRGPSMMVDAACASSLLAVHLACQSIWHGQSELAFAGGTNLVLAPWPAVSFSQAGMMAADGRCKAFSATGDGFVRSDGIGAVLLRPLSAARAQGNPVYAVILGSAAGNDGQSSGLMMTPGQQGQEGVLREAYARAGVDPRQVQYIEAHGTGTVAGDPVEVGALAAVLGTGAGRDPERPCLTGSVKSNIGHTEAAAGIAGLIKAVLCLHHRQIPASLHTRELNPRIDWPASGFAVKRTAGPWPDGARALAGVNSFGLSGTNVHVVLEGVPPAAGPGNGSEAGAARAMLLPLSARSADALRAQARRYAAFLAEGRGADRETGHAGGSASFADVCYTASERRTRHEHRLAVVAESAAEAARLLTDWAGDVAVSGVVTGQAAGDAAAGEAPGTDDGVAGERQGGVGTAVFVFPGQGGQWPGMGRELMAAEPVFAAAVARCAEAMAPFVPWSLTELLERGEIAGIDQVQPALFAVQVGLAALWRSWGLRPGAVIGHSMGEIAAAHVAGALSLPDAARVICRRSALMRRISGRGSMALVSLPADETERELAHLSGRVCVAAHNGPAATIVAGDAAAVAGLIADLESRQVFCRAVEVDVASHSSQVDELRADLLAELDGVTSRRTAVPLYSTVTGSPGDGTGLDAGYWMDNLRQPVLFAEAVRQAAAAGHGTFVEISPHPVLSAPVAQLCREDSPQATVLASSRRGEERRAMLEALGGLHCRGVLPLPRLTPPGARCVALPRYAWQHARYWARFADRWKPGQHGGDDGTAIRRHPDGSLAHPLLGRHFRAASQPSLHVFRTVLGPALMSYLSDHRVQGSVVFPAAGYAEMAFGAAGEVLGPGPVELTDVRFFRALVLNGDSAGQVRLELSAEGGDRAAFEIFAEPSEDSAEAVRLCAGMIRLLPAEATAAIPAARTPDDGASNRPVPAGPVPAEPVPDEPEKVAKDTLYDGLREAGLGYGPAFQGVTGLELAAGRVTATIELPGQVAGEAGRYRVHPALLDACLQALAVSATGPGGIADRGTFVPVSVRRIVLAGDPGTALTSRARIRAAESGPDRMTGDLTATAPDGRLVLAVDGLEATRLASGADDTGAEPRDWVYRLAWELAGPDDAAEHPAAPAAPAAPAGRWLILADDRGAAAALAAELTAAGADCLLVSHGSADSAPPGWLALDPADIAGWRDLLAQAGPVTDIAHLWSLDIPELGADGVEATARTLRDGQALGCESVLHLVQALAATRRDRPPRPPRLVLVTAGAQPAGPVAVGTGALDTGAAGTVAAAQAPVWGMGRALVHEQPELGCVLADLSSTADPAEAAALGRELLAGPEPQLAIRGEQRWVARLIPQRDEPDAPPAPDAPAPDAAAPDIAAPDEQVLLVNPAPGTLERLTWTRAARRAPGPGEIEIEVGAIGVNFKDVLLALGVNLGQEPGSFDAGAECAGRVTAVGEGVAEYRPGDAVVAFGNPSYLRYVIRRSDLAAPVPDGWSPAEAATLTVAYGTAYYALCWLARLRAGERVLIHAAAGGVGLAAVRIAQAIGAEVFATAGSLAKRDFLRAAGVAHVLDSRSLEFAGQIMELTGGRGVDVVLNSLAGPAMERSLEVLASFGRFVEIGMRDLHEHNRRIGLRHFQRSQSFFAVDLGRLHDEQPEEAGRLLRETIGFVAAHDLGPLPFERFEPAQAGTALRYLAQARHIGKLVIEMDGRAVPVTGPPGGAAEFRADGSYLITGGLGGLGLALARWMAGRGARHLALAGRSQAGQAAREVLAELRGQGVQVTELAVDVADGPGVRAMTERIGRELPPLRGVIHAAGVLDDGILAQLGTDQLYRALEPKVLGAWQLHAATRDLPLDLFVLFSSAAGLLGSPGQGNYCAGNTYLDALASQRASMGLPGLSISWGAWGEIGLAAAQANRGKRLAVRGVASMDPERALEEFGRALGSPGSHLAVMPFDFRQWCQFYPQDAEVPVFSRLPRDGDRAVPGGSAAGQAIRSAPPGERLPLVQDYLCERAGRILGFGAGRVDLDANLQRLGLDSLMAVELRNAIQADLGVEVPVLNLLQGTTIGQLAGLIDGQFGAAAPAAAGEPEEAVEHLSDQEVADLLAELDADTDVAKEEA